MVYLFLGERRSAKARTMGVTWESGNLSAKTLFHALRLNGVEPTKHRFDNLFAEGDGPLQLRPDARDVVLDAVGQGYWIIAMGNKVSDQLERLGIQHVKIRHPAARGAGRRTEVYVAHIAEQLALLSEEDATTSAQGALT